MAAGRVEIDIDSACRHGQPVTLRYGSYDIVRKLNAAGPTTLTLDLFLGKAETGKLTFADGTSADVAAAGDLNGISKIALIWKAPVDLDLHAQEGGRTGKDGHIWANAASTAESAKAATASLGRGSGFLSMTDDGQHDGTKIEVYTFIHHPEQTNGAVSMTLDYVSRGTLPTGDYCGTGSKASVPYEAILLSAKGTITRERGVIAAASCGVPLTPESRYLRDAVPDLDIGR